MTRSEFDAQAFGIDITAIQLRVLHGHRRTGDTQLDIAGHDLQKFPLVNVFEGIEVTDFGRQLGRKVTSGECREGRDTRSTGDKVLPKRIDTDPDWRNNAHARHDHARQTG